MGYDRRRCQQNLVILRRYVNIEIALMLRVYGKPMADGDYDHSGDRKFL